MIYTPKYITKAFLILLLVAGLFSCKRQRDINLKALLKDAQKLDEASEEQLKDNSRLVEKIKRNVDDRGNRPDEVELAEKGKAVLKYCKVISDSIKVIKDALVSEAGVKEKKDLADAVSIKESVNNNKLLNLYNSINEFREITMSKDSNYVYQRFKEQLSEKSYLSMQLVTLTALKMQVFLNADKFLKPLVNIMEERVMSFDKIKMEVIPETNIVEEGKIYKAKFLYIARGSSSYCIKSIACDGKDIMLDSSGAGIISFIAMADKFDKFGLCRKKISGSIRLNNTYTDSTFVFEQEYIIKKACK